MKLAPTREMFAYWDAARGERTAPEWKSLDPGGLRGAAADTFTLEVDARAEFPVRLSGSRLNALFCAELRGCSFLARWRVEDRHDLRRLLTAVIDHRAAIVAGVEAHGASLLSLELLALPLRHGGRTHTRIIGTLAPRQVPSWLGVAPVDGLRLMSVRVIAPDAIPRDNPAEPRRRAHLTIYEGGRVLA